MLVSSKKESYMNEQVIRDFKGVWIPREIYLNKELSWTEKLLLIEIDSLDCGDGCTASNNYFMDLFGLAERTVQLALAKLKELGFVEVVSFDGRQRILHSLVSVGTKVFEDDPTNRGAKNCTSEVQKVAGQRCNSCADVRESINNKYNNNILNNNIYTGNNNKGVVGGKEKGDTLHPTAEPKRFVKPSYDAVKAYIDEKNYDIDPNVFLDFYESNGWKVGKNPMKDWRAAVRTWGAKHGQKKKNEFYF